MIGMRLFNRESVPPAAHYGRYSIEVITQLLTCLLGILGLGWERPGHRQCGGVAVRSRIGICCCTRRKMLSLEVGEADSTRETCLTDGLAGRSQSRCITPRRVGIFMVGDLCNEPPEVRAWE
jgi:hypothetical protein